MISTLRCGSKMMMFFVTFIMTLCFLSKLKDVKSEVANSMSSNSMQVVESRKQKPLADLFSRFTNDDKKAHLSQGIVIIVFDCYSYLICFITTRSLNNFLSYIHIVYGWKLGDTKRQLSVKENSLMLAVKGTSNLNSFTAIMMIVLLFIRY